MNNLDKGNEFEMLLLVIKENEGVPIIINTSMNKKGKPITRNKDDIFTPCLKLDIDYMIISSALIIKCKRRKIKGGFIMSEKELVYFIYPTCDGNCKHCWSSDIRLGRYMDINWHLDKLKRIKKMNFSLIKLSGGEPFYNKEIGKISKAIYEEFGDSVSIQIFTSGRPFVSLNKGDRGILETKHNIEQYFKNYDNVSIHMSVDEYHLLVIKNRNKDKFVDYNDLSYTYINNFMNACFLLKKEHPEFDGPKLKIHCEKGRMEYHKQLYKWFPSEWWELYVIITEGLAYSGNAKKLENSFKVLPSSKMSYFFLPGVGFYKNKQTVNGIEFDDNGEIVYLDDAESAIIINGWWNLIDRRADYMTIN